MTAISFVIGPLYDLLKAGRSTSRQRFAYLDNERALKAKLSLSRMSTFFVQISIQTIFDSSISIQTLLRHNPCGHTLFTRVEMPLTG